MLTEPSNPSGLNKVACSVRANSKIYRTKLVKTSLQRYVFRRMSAREIDGKSINVCITCKYHFHPRDS